MFERLLKSIVLLVYSFIPGVSFLSLLVLNASYFPTSGVYSTSFNFIVPLTMVLSFVLAFVALFTKWRKYTLALLFLFFATFTNRGIYMFFQQSGPPTADASFPNSDHHQE